MMSGDTYFFVGVYRPRKGTGFGIPVFEARGELWVQRLDKKSEIVGFLPCDTERSDLIDRSLCKKLGEVGRNSDTAAIEIGEPGLFAFEDEAGSVSFGSANELSDNIRRIAASLEKHPFVLLDAATFLHDKPLEATARALCAKMTAARKKTQNVAVRDSKTLPPLPGRLAIVRNRPGVISKVEPSAAHSTGLVHLVTVDYTDLEGSREETVVWEREPDARVIQGTGLPRVADHDPMSAADFAGLQRSARWGAIHPFVDPDDTNGPLSRLPFSSPLHGAIEVEDYQMVPLLKAMRMPRVSLLLADDVGLGKTVEAGLILSELILQRRIQRILIITPASLRQQWQDELRQKFCLNFDVVDRQQTTQLRRRLGLDANPWRNSPHAIASYHYLKQPDVLEDFLATSHVPDGSPHLPWDLLIVDEAHNLAPAAFGEDSDLSSMLRRIAPIFEHKVFCTATPHNGRTRCFSGLLEILEPARFSQTSDFTPAERARVHEVVVRRLKSEINAVTKPPRFSERNLSAVPLSLSGEELQLSAAFSAFRSALHSAIARASRTERVAGAFAIEVLGKRLLSSLHAFADSWHRLVQGSTAPDEIAGTPATQAADVRASERAVREETGDDTEQESRTAFAAHVIGAWLRPLAPSLRAEMKTVTEALSALGLSTVPAPFTQPSHDTRYTALVGLVRERLRTPNSKTWLSGERLVVFTEYKTTLDSLVARLRAEFPDNGAIVQLFGSGEMDEREKEAVKAAFNDPASAVRILVATDAASEGLNLQRTARYLHHFDVPWNPARLEQRNGRIDRYGQARDVTVSHFISDDDADLAFMAFIVAKVHKIRHDLGATGEVIDAAVQRRLIADAPDADLRLELERDLARAKTRAEVPHDATAHSRDLTGGQALGEQLMALRSELDLSGDTLRNTFESALAHSAPPPRLQADGRPGFWRLVQPVPSSWRDVVDDSLRIPVAGAALGALPAIAFDPTACISEVAGRPIFRPPPDAALLHLWHPVMQHTLHHYARRRFPGQSTSASRWRVSVDPTVPATTDAWILITLEEIAVNDLRETFHHWVRTIVVPVKSGRLLAPLSHTPADTLSIQNIAPVAASALARARDLWGDLEDDLRRQIMSHSEKLTGKLRAELETERVAAKDREQARFLSRQAELSLLITESRLVRLERELDELQNEEGSLLFDPDGYVARLRVSAEEKQAELGRIKRHTEDLREQLQRERDRVLNQLLPRRYALRGEAQCLPVSVEIRFREVAV
jgi:hypothetical protein